MRRLKSSTAIALCAVLLLTTTGFDSCDKDKTPEEQKAEFLLYAKDINGAAISIGPLIAQLKPNLKPTWDKVTDISSRLIVAVEGSDKVIVTELLVELIPLFTSVASEFTDNTKVLVTLAIIDIGLHVFARHYKPSTISASGRPTAGKARVTAIEDYKKQKVWGCAYLPDKKACKELRKAA